MEEKAKGTSAESTKFHRCLEEARAVWICGREALSFGADHTTTRRVHLSTVQPCKANAKLKLGLEAALGLILSLERPAYFWMSLTVSRLQRRMVHS